MSHKEPVDLNRRAVLDYPDCLKYVEAHGRTNTIDAFHRSQFSVDPNTSVEFWWGDGPETPEERARCIRGAFHRISEEAWKDGRCSNHFTATFRVVSG